MPYTSKLIYVTLDYIECMAFFRFYMDGAPIIRIEISCDTELLDTNISDILDEIGVSYVIYWRCNNERVTFAERITRAIR